MYGNKPAGGLFGGAANTSFGGSAFGANTTPFGGNQGSTFGGGAFGNTQTSGGGMFGATGGGGLFGGASTSTAGGGLFGGTGAFGNTNPTSTNNTFGFGGGTQVTTQQSMGLFGNNSSNTFGGTSLFGQPQQQQPQQQQQQQQSSFGQTGGSLFGGMMGGGGGGFLGATQATGTTVKFVPVVSNDQMVKGGVTTNINTKLQCITAMKEYEAKSLEELRVEDYSANRKSASVMGGAFGMAGTNTGTGFMTANQPTSGFSLFGNQNKPGFSGFGASSTAAGSTSLFGGQGFGTQSKPLFGAASLASTTTATNTFGGLGANTGGSFFGANTNKFGATTATTQPSLGFSFGATQQNATPFSLNTAQNNTTGGFFGKKPALGFGQPVASSAAATPAFGFKPANQTPLGAGTGFGTGTSLFNKPAASTATATFGFGAAPAAGGTSLGFGGFGTSQAASTSLGTPGFGVLSNQAAPASNLFEAAKPAGSLFGATSTPAFNLGGGGGAFMGSSLAAPTNVGGALGAPQAPNEAWVQQINEHIKALNRSPYGDSPLFKNLVLDPSRKEELTRPTNPAAQKSIVVSHMKTSTGHKIKTTPKALPLASTTMQSNIFEELEDKDTTQHQTKSPFNSSSSKRNYKELNPQARALAADYQLRRSTIRPQEQGLDYASDEYYSPERFIRRTTPNGYFNDFTSNFNNNGPHNDNTMVEFNVLKNVKRDSLGSPNLEKSHPKVTSNTGVHSNTHTITHTSTHTSSHASGVVLTKEGYYTVPSVKKMDGMVDEEGACWVDGLVVGREGYGSVMFPGLTNVAGLNLDEIVFFRTKELEIYPVEGSKPPQGKGLNRRAQVTLERAFPSDKNTGKLITDYSRLREMGYIRKLQRKSVKMGAQFVDFTKEGHFIFLVEHFSKYTLNDDSDDSEDDQTTPSRVSQPIKSLYPHQPSLSTATNIVPADHLTNQNAPRLFSATLDHQLKMQHKMQHQQQQQLNNNNQQHTYPGIYPNIISLSNDSSSADDEYEDGSGRRVVKETGALREASRHPYRHTEKDKEQEVPMAGDDDNDVDADDDDDAVTHDDEVETEYDNNNVARAGDDGGYTRVKHHSGKRAYTGLGGYVEADDGGTYGDDGDDGEDDETDEGEGGEMEGVVEDVAYDVTRDMELRGVSSQRVQLQKAFIFGGDGEDEEEEEEDGGDGRVVDDAAIKRNNVRATFGAINSHRADFVNSSIGIFKESHLEEPTSGQQQQQQQQNVAKQHSQQQHDYIVQNYLVPLPTHHHPLPTVPIPPQLPPTSIPSSILHHHLPLIRSVIHHKQHSLTDLSLYHGFSFRVCCFHDNKKQGWLVSRLGHHGDGDDDDDGDGDGDGDDDAAGNDQTKRLSMGIHEMRLLSGGRVGMRGRVGRRMVGVESLNIPTWFQGDLKRHLVSCLDVELKHCKVTGKRGRKRKRKMMGDEEDPVKMRSEGGMDTEMEEGDEEEEQEEEQEALMTDGGGGGGVRWVEGSDDDQCPHVTYSTEPQALLRNMIGCLKRLPNQSEWTVRMLSVWRLCWALWGQLASPEKMEGERGGVLEEENGRMMERKARNGGVDNDYFVAMVRKMRLSQWLTRSCKDVIEKEIAAYKQCTSTTGNHDDDDFIAFSYLTGHMLNKAVQSALSIKDSALALLLSQNTLTDDDKLLLRKQLQQWIDTKTDRVLGENSLKIVSLLSGQVELRGSRSINCCQHLDWKRTFGMHLWHTTTSTSSIEAALHQYEEAFLAQEAPTPLPRPPYEEGREGGGKEGERGSSGGGVLAVNKEAENESRREGRGEKDKLVCDVVFHLLKLFSDHSHPLHLLLNPLNSLSNQLDYSCSWHMLKLLGSLNYRHLGNQHHAYICHNYASQLEASGLWWWAVFVLMHINEPAIRKDAVRKLIFRNVTCNNKLDDEEDDDDEDEDDEGDDEDVYNTTKYNNFANYNTKSNFNAKKTTITNITTSNNTANNTTTTTNKRDLATDADALLNEKDSFVVEVLGVAGGWVHEAKAHRAAYLDRRPTQARHLFRAGLLSQYALLLTRHMVPAMVVAGRFSALKYWLCPLLRGGLNGGVGGGNTRGDGVASDVIDGDSNASVGGGERRRDGGNVGGGNTQAFNTALVLLYVRYVELAAVVKRLTEEEKVEEEFNTDILQRIEALKSLVDQVSSSIHLLPTHSPLEKLSQSIISKAVSTAIALLLKIESKRGSGAGDDAEGGADDDYANLAEMQLRLPLPIDCLAPVWNNHVMCRYDDIRLE